MAALTETQKLFVVQELGAFRSPSEVVDLLREEHGVETTTSQIARYNPLTKSGESLSEGLRQAFHDARAAFIVDRESIAIAHVSYRLRELLDLYRANKRKSPVVASSLLEQAAKEVGGAYTQGKITPEQLAAYAGELTENFAAAVSRHVKDEETRERILADVRERMEKDGGSGGPG